MKYIELVIHTNRAGLEPVEACLMDMGIEDMVINDPGCVDMLLDKEHDYDWDYVDDAVLELKNEEPNITIYFDGDECGNGYVLCQQVDMAIEGLRQELMNGAYGTDADFGSLTVTTSLHDDSEWKDNWKEFFKPAKVSEHIIVKPTWENYELSGDEIASGVRILEIDPGMAFGTGTHETTSLCIKAIEKYMKPGDKVLDVGCGSGILSIVAALLGAGDALGIEIDPIAVDVSNENIALNHVQNVAHAQYGDLTKGVDYDADIIVANMMANLIIMLTPDIKRHMKPGCKYISSGILDEKLVEVADCIRFHGFKIDEVRQDGMWCAIVASL